MTRATDYQEQVYQALMDQFEETIKQLLLSGDTPGARNIMEMRDSMDSVRKERDELRFRMEGLEH